VDYIKLSKEDQWEVFGTSPEEGGRALESGVMSSPRREKKNLSASAEKEEMRQVVASKEGGPKGKPGLLEDRAKKVFRGEKGVEAIGESGRKTHVKVSWGKQMSASSNKWKGGEEFLRFEFSAVTS